jgi:hypothetical protein
MRVLLGTTTSICLDRNNANIFILEYLDEDLQ